MVYDWVNWNGFQLLMGRISDIVVFFLNDGTHLIFGCLKWVAINLFYALWPMTTQDNCGFTSYLPTSCRDRAEAIARSIKSRLNSLGSQSNGDATSDESTCSENSVKHTPSKDVQNESTESNNSEESTEMYYLIQEVQPNPINTCSSNGIESEGTEATENVELSCANFDSTNATTNGENETDVKFAEENVLELNEQAVDLFYCDENDYYISSAIEEIMRNALDIVECKIEHSARTMNIDEQFLKDFADLVRVTKGEAAEAADNLRVTTHDEVEMTSDEDEGVSVKRSRRVIPENEAALDYVQVKTGNDTVANLDDLQVTPCNAIEVNQDLLPVKLDDEDDTIPRVRRWSSLKTGRTPPGTPERKKIVRFADAFGLDLIDVRTCVDEVPKVPVSAYSDLSNLERSSSAGNVNEIRTLLPSFRQPGGNSDFLDKVRTNYVMLENAVVEDPTTFSIRGTVRVRNLDFNKSVHVRYSVDAWKSFTDLQAVYVDNSCDGFSDKFTFLLYAYTLSIGQRLELAVGFQCRGSQYWDNNGGENYCFECLRASSPQYEAAAVGSNERDDRFATFY